MNFMKNLVLGILAHVDAGKTTMAEAMLFSSGKIRNLGRVDHKDAFLDNNSLERERGITIFSKQAVFDFGELRINLLDTPGHMDFSSEMERTLGVLDYAILVISAPDGVQAHTQTLWSLLSRYHVPVFIWVNKMDQSVFSKEDILAQLKKKLSPSCVDFSVKDDAFSENTAVCDELLLERFLDGHAPEKADLQGLILSRKLFPCYFGSALKLSGVEEFLADFAEYVLPKNYSDKFAARVFKIAHDEKGEKLSYIKITGGSLKVRDSVGEDKISQIRQYNGAKFEALSEVCAGAVCAVAGLSNSYAGQGLGAASDTKAPLLEPVLLYRIIPPAGTDIQDAFRKFSALSEEDPMLRIVWNSQLKEIQAMLMGEVQIEVLKRIIKDRFDMDVEIDTGRIMYRETIESPVEGMGHYEPLRHYAEVHFLMEPLPAGSGLVFESACSTDVFDLNWQRLVMGHLAEKTHLGVLTGSPITDIKITLVAGRAHVKHTEGGDFRQAVYRAVRQGLMQAKNVLLEPWYDFRIEVPAENIGRALSDVQTMSAAFEAPEDLGETMVLSGRAPVSEMNDYQKTMMSYTKGRGRIACTSAGYFPCHNTAQVIESIGYDADRDVENTADSVFCSHGAGVIVKWNHAKDFMHLDSGLRFGGEVVKTDSSPKVKTGHFEFNDKELEDLMLKEFGPIKRPQYSNVKYTQKPVKAEKTPESKPECIIADGYNLIFSDEAFKAAAKDNISIAREKLLDLLSNFAAYRGCELIAVFDGYKVKDNPGTSDDYHGIKVIYTPDGITADGYIEKLIHESTKDYSIKVVSSDGLIQLSALREGVLRMSAREFFAETENALGEISDILEAPRERTTLADGARIVD